MAIFTSTRIRFWPVTYWEQKIKRTCRLKSFGNTSQKSWTKIRLQDVKLSRALNKILKYRRNKVFPAKLKKIRSTLKKPKKNRADFFWKHNPKRMSKYDVSTLKTELCGRKSSPNSRNQQPNKKERRTIPPPQPNNSFTKRKKRKERTTTFLCRLGSARWFGCLKQHTTWCPIRPRWRLW